MICIWFAFSLLLVCCWFTFGLLLAYLQFAIGVLLVCLWFTFDLYLACFGFAFGSPLLYLCFAFGLLLVCRRFAPGLLWVDLLFLAFGLPWVCFWFAFGLSFVFLFFLVCLWFAFGLSVVWHWFSFGLLLVCFWCWFRLHLVCPWLAFGFALGLPLICLRFAFGLPSVCLWLVTKTVPAVFFENYSQNGASSFWSCPSLPKAQLGAPPAVAPPFQTACLFLLGAAPPPTSTLPKSTLEKPLSQMARVWFSQVFDWAQFFNRRWMFCAGVFCWVSSPARFFDSRQLLRIGRPWADRAGGGERGWPGVRLSGFAWASGNAEAPFPCFARHTSGRMRKGQQRKSAHGGRSLCNHSEPELFGAATLLRKEPFWELLQCILQSVL